MVVDAADETMGVVVPRVFDAEDIDISIQNGTLKAFLQRIWALFGPRAQCVEVPRFTFATCTLLNTESLYQSGARREVGTLGGRGHPTAEHV